MSNRNRYKKGVAKLKFGEDTFVKYLGPFGSIQLFKKKNNENIYMFRVNVLTHTQRTFRIDELWTYD